MNKVNLAVSKRGLLEAVGTLAIFAGGNLWHWYRTRNDVPNAVKDAESKAARKYGEKLKAMDELRRKDNELFKQIIDSLMNNHK